MIRVLIASALEPECVERIARVDDRVQLLYEPDLLPVPRYVADHHGPRRDLTPAQLDHWRSLLAAADVSFDFDWWSPADMATHCPHLRWIQASSAGIGQFMQRTHLDDSPIVVTTAAGIHAVPLAEFALTCALYFTKEVPALLRWQKARHWERYTTRQLAGRKVAVVGLGQVGQRIVSVFSTLGAEVWGVGRPGGTSCAPGAACVVSTAEIDGILPSMSVLILCCPLTAGTRGIIDERRLRLLPRGAIVVNIARGPLVDEAALIAALQDGHLGGAGLDVFATEPLPPDSPLWTMDHVLVSPHSASTVAQENALLTDLFCDNLRRWIDGLPLRNVYHPRRGY